MEESPATCRNLSSNSSLEEAVNTATANINLYQVKLSVIWILRLIAMYGVEKKYILLSEFVKIKKIVI